MCMGGGGAATITQPDYTAYNQQFELQKSAIEQQMNNSTQLKQSQMSAAVKQQQDLLTQSNETRRQLAENTNAQAMRMAQLIGTPPPEKSAEAPVVGRSRGETTTKGKGALRIERQLAAASSSQGAGLNIT